MRHPSPRTLKYSKNGVILTIGVDENGRLFSNISKNGQVVVRDMYVKFPSEAKLASEGWTRYHE